MLLGKDPQTSLIACISSPHGGDTTEIKVKAIKDAVKNGVDEVEVTAPIAYVKDANWGYVKRELKKLKGAYKHRKPASYPAGDNQALHGCRRLRYNILTRKFGFLRNTGRGSRYAHKSRG